MFKPSVLLSIVYVTGDDIYKLKAYFQILIYLLYVYYVVNLFLIKIVFKPTFCYQLAAFGTFSLFSQQKRPYLRSLTK